MTPVAPSQVHCKVSIAYTSILIQVVTTPVQTVVNTTLLVIRVHHLMTQVSSTAHMYLFRWYVQLVRTPSNQKLRLQDPLWSGCQPIRRRSGSGSWKTATSMQTVTTEEFKSRTSCDSGLHFHQRVFRDPLFFI